MNKFKVGDKVKVVKPCASLHLGIGEVYEVKRVSSSETLQIDGSPYYWDFDRFEIVKDTPEFDMKKEKWFIRTPTPEISKLVQEWLFEQGFIWQGGFKEKEIIQTDKKFLMKSSWREGEFCWTDEPIGYQIKLSFKTIIDSVEYPLVETEQDKAIRELEETIAKAAEQIKQLKGEK